MLEMDVRETEIMKIVYLHLISRQFQMQAERGKQLFQVVLTKPKGQERATPSRRTSLNNSAADKACFSVWFVATCLCCLVLGREWGKGYWGLFFGDYIGTTIGDPFPIPH